MRRELGVCSKSAEQKGTCPEKCTQLSNNNMEHCGFTGCVCTSVLEAVHSLNEPTNQTPPSHTALQNKPQPQCTRWMPSYYRVLEVHLYRNHV